MSQLQLTDSAHLRIIYTLCAYARGTVPYTSHLHETRPNLCRFGGSETKKKKKKKKVESRDKEFYRVTDALTSDLTEARLN